MSRRLVVIAAGLVAAAIAAAAAFGYRAGRVVEMHRGDRADFTVPSGLWSCFDRGATVSCGSGDAWPFVELSSTSHGVTIRVHTLKSPQQGRITHAIDRDGDGVYTFTALP